MTVHIRPAVPTATDAAAFATLANIASHNINADMLGPGWHGTLSAMFHDDRTLYRHRQVWFSLEGGDIAGMLCGFSGADKESLNEATDRYFIASPALNDPIVAEAINQFAPISGQIDAVPSSSWYIQFLAVLPEWRGRGHAAHLLNHAIDLAREHGSSTVELDVEVDNDAALAAYRRAGFAVTETSPTVRYNLQDREIGLHRMVRPAN